MKQVKFNKNSVRENIAESRLRYLTYSSRIAETLPLRMARLTMAAVSITVLFFIGWAGIVKVSEVARTSGEVVPEGFQQIVQHLEGGILDEILVKEGQAVKEGDILVRISGTGASEDLDRVRRHQISLAMQKERLTAFIEDRRPDFVKIISENPDPQSTESQLKMYTSMLETRQKERSIIEEQIKQKEGSIAILKSRQGMVTKNLNLTRDMYERRKELFNQGYVSRISFMETEQEMNALSGEGDQIRNEIKQAQAGIKEFQDRLTSLDARHKDDAWQQLEIVTAEMAQNEKVIEKFQNQVNRLDVKAPVAGFVKGLNVNTIGGVVQPAQTLMEIVPQNHALEVDIRIPPRHIGHIRHGQPVQVKFSSYDFSRYGSVEGHLEYISATTFMGEEGERYYRGKVKLSQDYVGERPGENVVMPGMTVMADIVTGNKTILQYLLKPIQASLMTSFTER